MTTIHARLASHHRRRCTVRRLHWASSRSSAALSHDGQEDRHPSLCRQLRDEPPCLPATPAASWATPVGLMWHRQALMRPPGARRQDLRQNATKLPDECLPGMALTRGK